MKQNVASSVRVDGMYVFATILMFSVMISTPDLMAAGSTHASSGVVTKVKSSTTNKRLVRQNAELSAHMSKRLQHLERKVDAMIAAESHGQAENRTVQHRVRQLETTVHSSSANQASMLQQAVEKAMGKAVFSKSSGLSLYGYVETSYTYNFNQPQSGVNHLRIFDVDSNAFRMHMAQVVLEKEGKGDGSHLDRVGFRAKLNFGEDSQFTGGSDFNDEVDFQEAYVQYIAPVGTGLDLRMGRMNTLIGYEVIESPYNPNFTRSWLFGLGEPFTTTGIRAGYQVNDWVGFAVGGISSFTQGPGDNNANVSLESAIFITPNDMVSLTGFFFYGDEGGRSGATGDLTLFGGIASLQATEATSFVVEAYLANQANASTISPSGNARWNGAAAYIIHDFTEQWGVRFRGEIFEDAGGARTCGGAAGTLPNANVCFGTAPVAQTLWEGTATIQFKPVPPLITRLEFRYDKSDKNTFRIGNRGANHQETVAFEAIYLF